MGLSTSVSFKFIRVALISGIPPEIQYCFDSLCYAWLGWGSSFRSFYLAFCTVIAFIPQMSQWVCTSCQVGQSHYTFGD